MGASQGLRSPGLSAGQRSPGAGTLPSYSDGASSSTQQFPFATSTYDEKYPPRQSTAPVDLPLLHADDALHHEEAQDRRNSRSTHRSAPALLSARTRLHPLTLFPAFVLGILLAMTGIFGTSSYFRKPPGVLQNSYSLNRSNDGELRVATVRPQIVLHSSGHLFLHPSSLDPASPSSPLSPSEAAVAPKGIRHPIHDLIANATRDWEAKLSRQSTTLEQAVIEYRRRYSREPPVGFDDWFAFAQENKVVLIDEFDSIIRDVHLFNALSPKLLHERGMRLQDDASTFTMRIKDGETKIVGPHRADGRAKDQLELMKRWMHLVPDVNISMSAHDGPSIMMDHVSKQLHLDAANSGKTLTDEEASITDDDASFWGFPLSCPPESRLRRAYNGLEIDSLPHGPSYVYDHLATMDLCKNPEWQYLHGFTAWPGMRPQNLTPIFSFAKTSLHSDLLLTPLEQYWDKERYDPPWEQKVNNKAIWRGSTTGVWFDRGTWWRSSQRVRLYFMSQDKIGVQSVRFDGVGQESAKGVESIAERKVSTEILMNRYLDFAFSGKAGQCTEIDGSCDAVKRLIKFVPTIGWGEANDFKYLLDLDGNAWSGRFHRLLSSNAAIIKSTIFPEWYSGWIQPWVHYIPVKIDYSDIFDVLAFFSGDLDGRNGHEALAKAIAVQGKEYAKKYWRYEDMEAYFFRLSLEWARVSSPDRSAMDYTGT